MIVRLTLGSEGPRLGSSVPIGIGHRSRGARRALVVVSKALYCESAANEWPGIGGPEPVLEARCRGSGYTASSTLLRHRDEAGIRGPLVPEEALRNESTSGALSRSNPLYRRWRSLSVVRARFRQPVRVRLLLVRAALTIVFATSLVTLAATSATALEARKTLARAESMRADLASRVESLARLREEAQRLGSGDSRRLPALPGRLVSALASTLAPGERITSVAADGFDFTLVAEGGLGLGMRVDALDRIRTTGHTVTNRDGLTMVTVRAQQEGGER